jgi:hypothetical protein
LVIDWDQDRCNILEGIVTRAGVKIERAVAWAQEEIFAEPQGADAGRKLREFLKSSNIAPAPLLVCLPKQRVLLKELRCPSVSEADEPAMVRFQGTKELLENPDDVILDYSHLSRSATESLILLTAMRKDLLAGYTALAKEAGLKLLAVTPRPFVLGDLLARCRKIDPVPAGPAHEWSAVLLLGGSWAELTILHEQTVCFARSMANDEAITSEVRRSLAMFATQVQGRSPQILYLFGQSATAELQDKLAEGLRIPVTRPAVLSGDDAGGVDSPAGVGLLAAWGAEKLAVNFAKPKEPKPPPPGNKRLWVLVAGGAMVLLAMFTILSQKMLADTKDEIARAKEEKDNIDKKLKGFEQERLDLDALDDWEGGTFPWNDELYNITAAFPFDPPGFHLKKFEGNVKSRNKSDKSQAQGRVSLVVTNPLQELEKFPWVKDPRDKFQASLPDAHAQVTPGLTRPDGTYVINVDLTHQPVEKYAQVKMPKLNRIAPPPPKEPAPVAGPPGDKEKAPGGPVAVVPPGDQPAPIVRAVPPAVQPAPAPPPNKGAKKKPDEDDDDD